MSLFREEVIRQQQQRYHGAIVLRSPKVFVWLSIFVFVFALLLMCVLIWGEYTRRASLSGYVIPEGGVLRIFSPLGGRVGALHVHEGQEVQAGYALLAVLDERYSGQGAESRGAIVAQIESRKNSLRAIIGEQKLLYQRTRSGLQTRLQALEREQIQLLQEQRTLEQRLEQAAVMEQRFRDLHTQNFASVVQLQEKTDAASELRYRVQLTERNQTSIARELQSLQTELEVLPMRERTQLSELERSLQGAEQELIETQSRREMVVRAPMAGRVTGLSAKLGAGVDLERPLMTFVPLGQDKGALEVHLFAPSRDAGFIRPGQSVRIRYQAYPYQKFGHYEGVVQEVSGSPMLPAELPYPVSSKSEGLSALADFSTMSSATPRFRIRIRPKNSYVLAYGQKQMLQTGMQVEADVMLDTRSLLEWIFEPLLSVRGKYF
jgi:membrane fusion protein